VPAVEVELPVGPGLAVRVVLGLVGVGVLVGTGVDVLGEVEVLAEAEMLVEADVDGEVLVDEGVGVTGTDCVVVGTVIAAAVGGGAVGVGATVVDDVACGIGVAVPAAPLQPARITVRAASAHPNRIRTAAG
jgi:hypothetical protein